MDYYHLECTAGFRYHTCIEVNVIMTFQDDWCCLEIILDDSTVRPKYWSYVIFEVSVGPITVAFLIPCSLVDIVPLNKLT